MRLARNWTTPLDELVPEGPPDAAIAANRFGLGARPGDLEPIAEDPRGWLLQQLKPAPLPPELANQPTGREGLEALIRTRGMEQDRRRAERRRIRRAFRRQAADHALVAVTTEQPFRERLIRFWANHFSVSIRSPALVSMAPAFEREVIRANIDGRFYDMLLAAVRHPAMLVYFNNERSIGPASRFGIRKKVGLNENLAREILELHTIGADAGYTQEDVEGLARLLTGWSVAGVKEEDPGSFVFRPNWHEPGNKTFLEQNYPETGVLEGEAALDALANNPLTMRRLAWKMVRHFIADDPPASLVNIVARAYAASDGSLAFMSAALVNAAESWNPAPAKVKTPHDLVVSTMRGLDLIPRNGRMLVRSMTALEQPPFAAPSPEGWSDEARDWIGPEALMERLEWTAAVGTRVGTERDPVEHALAILGPTVRPATLRRITVAEDGREAMAILLGSPEFQRR